VTDTVPHDPTASMYGPVTDWATDFDHADPEYNVHANEIWADLRERCPVAHTGRSHGAWLPVTHADVSRIAYDTERFTSRSVVVSTAEQLAEAPIGGAPPITSDPPFHHHARCLLLPPFSPSRSTHGRTTSGRCATTSSTRWATPTSSTRRSSTRSTSR
jgi:cytochrome P450